MKKHLLFVSKEAWDDLNEISEWYEKQQAGLGERFILEFDLYLQKLSNNPSACSFIFKNRPLRKLSLKKFPYKICFILKNGTIEILAVIHFKRSARYIRRRLG